MNSITEIAKKIIKQEFDTELMTEYEFAKLVLMQAKLLMQDKITYC